MFLGEIAQEHMKEVFNPYDSTKEDFSTSTIEGRLGPTDRFLSIYSLPTKKRQLFVKPNIQFPASRVIKHSTSGRIYLVGTGRMDARHDVDGGSPYQEMFTVHEVGSTGYGFTGKAVAKKLSRDLTTKYLVYTPVGDVYADLEFRSTINDNNTIKETDSGFFCWHQADVELNQWDVIELGGVEYRVTDNYVEAGLRSCRVTTDKNQFINIQVVKTIRSYNEVTYQYEESPKTENVTAILSSDVQKTAWADGSKPRVVLYIPFIAITNQPEVGDNITYNGISKVVKFVEHRTGERQTVVTCE